MKLRDVLYAKIWFGVAFRFLLMLMRGAHMCNANNHSSNCTCGFGGTGHKGKSLGGYGGGNTSLAGIRTATSRGLTVSKTVVCRAADFCAKASCHYCGAAIYFVRHNGGSVWFDDLGWPWPKHPCYYKDKREDLVYSGLIADSRSLKAPLPVLIVKIGDKVGRAHRRLGIQYPNGNVTSVLVSVLVPCAGLQNTIALFSDTDKILLHPLLGRMIVIVEPGSTTLPFDNDHSGSNIRKNPYKNNLKRYKRELRERPDDVMLHYKIGSEYLVRQAYSEAITAFQECIRLRRVFAEAYYQIGIAFEKSGKWHEAAEAYKQAFTIKKGFTSAYLQYGQMCVKLRLYSDAEQAFNRVMFLDPDRALAYYHLALVYIALDDTNRAKLLYSRLKGMDNGLAEKLRAKF